MLNFDYDHELPSLKRLITLSNRAQWNAEDIDWAKPLSKRGGDYEPVLEWHGLMRNEYVMALSPQKREALARQIVACEFSQILHGEQAAMMLAGQLTTSVHDLDARIFAASQARDEARHVVAVRGIVDRLGPIYPIGRVLRENLEMLLECHLWPKQVLGLQLFLEARALLSFRQTLLFVRDPVFQDVTKKIERDEAHHVAFGIQYLKTGIDELSPDERAELLEYTRYLHETLWLMTEPEEFRAAYEEVDLDYDECIAAKAASFSMPQIGLGKYATVERMHAQFTRWFAGAVRKVGLAEALAEEVAAAEAPSEHLPEPMPSGAVEPAVEDPEPKLPWIDG
ncbi:ferritin-like domain-containing protein [Myxococcota bacterium]|nr:ferritin-like domain-containing protein [Myxococcota bacterium]